MLGIRYIAMERSEWYGILKSIAFRKQHFILFNARSDNPLFHISSPHVKAERACVLFNLQDCIWKFFTYIEAK